MAERKCRARLTELNQRLALLRPRFVAALGAMDYELALAYQREIDHLRDRRKTLKPSGKHLYLLQQAASSPPVIISKDSRRSEPVGETMFFDPLSAQNGGEAVAPA
jgi:hypothetical protein